MALPPATPWHQKNPEPGPSTPRASACWPQATLGSQKRSITSARFNHKAATLNNIIYVVGGLSPTVVPLRRVDAYNVATNTWSARRSLPSARGGPDGVSVINGRPDTGCQLATKAWNENSSSV